MGRASLRVGCGLAVGFRVFVNRFSDGRGAENNQSFIQSINQLHGIKKAAGKKD